MSPAAEADRLLRKKSYQPALEQYRALVEGGGTADQVAEWRLRVCICLYHAGKMKSAREATISLLGETRGTIWHVRALHWVAVLQDEWYGGMRRREALEAARSLYPEFRGQYDTRLEEIRLNFDLLASLLPHRDGSNYYQGPETADSPLWEIDPEAPYSPDWPEAKRIRYLLLQIRRLAGDDPDLRDAVLSAGIMEAYWLRQQRNGAGETAREGRGSQDVHPYSWIDYREHLRALLGEFAGSPREPELWLTLGGLASADGDFTTAEAAFEAVRQWRPKGKQRRAAEESLAALRYAGLWLSGVTMQEAGRPARVRLWCRNVEAVELQLHRLDLERARTTPVERVPEETDYDPFEYLMGPWSHVRRFLTPVGESWREALPGMEDRWWHHRELEVPLPGPGPYLLTARTGNLETAVFVVSTGIALVARSGGKNSRLYVLDAGTGNPVPGTELRVHLHPSWNPKLPEDPSRETALTTNADGWTEVPVRDSKPRYSAYARSGEHYALLSGHTLELPDPREEYRAFGAVDRGAYRPGEELHFRWIVMRRVKGAWRPVPELKVRVRLTCVQSGRGPDCKVTTDAYGCAAGSLALAPDLPTGLYRLEIAGKGSRQVSGGLLRVRVEEFRPPDAELIVTPPTSPVAQGEVVVVRVQGRYLSGEPVQGKVRYRVRVVELPAWYRPELERLPLSYWGDGQELTSGELQLDASGAGEIAVVIAKPTDLPSSRSLLARVDVELKESGNQTIHGCCRFEIAGSSGGAILRAEAAYGRAGKAVRLSLRAARGGSVPTGSGAVIVRRCPGPGGSPEGETVLPVEWNESGEAQVDWVPTAGGKYELAAGNEEESEPIAFWVHGAGDTDSPAGPLQVLISHGERREGETLQALVVAPEPGCTLLVRHESTGAMLREEWVNLPGRTWEWVLPLGEPEVPAIHLYVRTLREGEVHEVTAPVSVAPVKPVVHVEVQCEPPAGGQPGFARPGDGANLRLETRDWQGRPVDASLSLGVRNAAVDAVQPMNGNVVEAFFTDWHFRLTTGSEVGSRYTPYLPHCESPERPHFSWHMPPLPDPLAFGTLPGFHSGKGWELTAWVDVDCRVRDCETLRDDEDTPPGVYLPGRTYAGCYEYGCAFAELHAPEPDPEGIRVRHDFRNTAFWDPAIATGKGGAAAVRFDWPDDLTEWRARAVAVTREGRVGQAEVSLRTTLPLLLRPRCPRFLIAGDQAVLGAVLQSSLPDPVDLVVTLELEHPDAALLGLRDPLDPAEREVRVRLAPGATAHVEWRVEVREPGELRVRMTAAGPGLGDAAELTVPVLVRGAIRTEAAVGMLHSGESSARFVLPIPALRQAGTTRLCIRSTPTLLGVVAGALRYLRAYPYGCAEQTISGIWPAAIAETVLERFGAGPLSPAEPHEQSVRSASLPATGRTAYTPPDGVDAPWLREGAHLGDAKELEAAVARGLKRLKAGQNSDGGWGWWSGSRSNPAITHYVYRGLRDLSTTRHRVPAEMLEGARRYMTSLLHQKTPLPELVETVFLLSQDESADSELGSWAGEFLLPKRRKLDTGERALLGMALYHLGEGQRAAQVVEELEQEISSEALEDGAWWPAGRGNAGWRYGPVEVTARVLQALILVRPQSDRIDASARRLAQSRRGAAWRSTRETAEVIAALLKYAALRGETEPDYLLHVGVNGAEAGRLEFRGGDRMGEQSLVVAEPAIAGVEAVVDLERAGTGTAYTSAVLTCFTEDFAGSSPKGELSLRRRYYRLEPRSVEEIQEEAGPEPERERPNPYLAGNYDPEEPKPSWERRSTPPPYRRVLWEPGEPIRTGDLLEVELELEAASALECVLIEDLRPAGCEPEDPLSGPYWGAGDSYREVRDDKVAFFLRWVLSGRTRLNYRLRAETAGRFWVLPAQAFAMYAPEIHTLSGGIRMEIR